MNRFNDDGTHPSEVKRRKKRTILKGLALIMIIVGILLLIFGLLPQERVVVSNKQLQGGYINCFSAIDANEGDILVIDYSIEGPDVTFYLSYEEPCSEDNRDYIEKRDHARNDHLEIDIETTGTYYFTFERNDPASSESFYVDLSYKIMDRYSPVYIILGIMFIILGIVLLIANLILKRRGQDMERDYIRI